MTEKIKEIKRVFDEKHITNEVLRQNGIKGIPCLVFARINGVYQEYEAVFTTCQEHSDKIEVEIILIQGREEKRQELVNFVNYCNARKSLFKLYVAKAVEVVARWDFPRCLPVESAGKVAYELLIDFLSRENEIFPTLQKIVQS